MADTDELLDSIQRHLDRISATLDVLIRVRAAELPADQAAAFLAELDAIKQQEASHA